MEKRPHSCTERPWSRTGQVGSVLSTFTHSLLDLASSWTWWRRRRRWKSSIWSCRLGSLSKSCDASPCGKETRNLAPHFSDFQPECPRLAELWIYSLLINYLWYIILYEINATQIWEVGSLGYLVTNLVKNFVTNLVMNLVNHRIWWWIRWKILWRI